MAGEAQRPEGQFRLLEPPAIAEASLADCLSRDFNLSAATISFLPLGADRDSAVYRVVDRHGRAWFLKLRRGEFAEVGVAIPKLLADQGIDLVIGPVATAAGRLWSRVAEFTVTIYPFVAGRSGYIAGVADRHWVELGGALRRIHAGALPSWLAGQIPRETYTGYWRDRVREFQALAEGRDFVDAVATDLAAFLRAQRGVIAEMVERAERYAVTLRAKSAPLVLCHADLHRANLLIGDDGALHIVDWDTATLAPKERDLMFFGGGFSRVGDDAREIALFYQGYGQTELDGVALAYYRFERIVQDVAAYSEQLLLTAAGGADRPSSLGKLKGSFAPNNVVDLAFRSDTRS